eukprot:c11722_g1_i2.p1 GENE.c11722_g1_i2~~c11722_g1_i2.p1  ORF type:complete len:177 (-),score=31.23 c11722_g1_i2:503-1033(-)
MRCTVVLLCAILVSARHLPKGAPAIQEDAQTPPVIHVQPNTEGSLGPLPRQHNFAFVTFIARKSDVDAAGILAKSLVASGTTNDLVAVPSSIVDEDDHNSLVQAGWKVFSAGEVPNPYPEQCNQIQGKTPRSCFEYTLLRLWNLPYSKVSLHHNLSTSVCTKFRWCPPTLAYLHPL